MNCPKFLKILIIQPVVTHYRIKLYELLYQQLLEQGIKLQVVYGGPTVNGAAKREIVDLPENIGLKVNNYWLFGDRLLYQPVFMRMLTADLVIVLNANGHLLNYPLSLIARLGRPKLAFWVWWQRTRSNTDSLAERLRRFILKSGQWWFAYTAGIGEYLLQDGIPAQQITILNNSVDTSQFQAALAAITANELQDFADLHQIPQGAPIGLFCGGLYADKRLEFLFTALKLVHTQHPDFHLLVIGDGIQRDVVLQAARQEPRIHYLGPCFGKEKALAFRLASLFLCPGLVGLAILDAFTAGLPMLTTDIPYHSPEIEYLEHDENGLCTKNDVEAYAAAVTTLLESAAKLHALKNGALNSAQYYSIENMAELFANGIVSCLKRP